MSITSSYIILANRNSDMIQTHQPVVKSLTSSVYNQVLLCHVACLISHLATCGAQSRASSDAKSKPAESTVALVLVSHCTDDCYCLHSNIQHIKN